MERLDPRALDRISGPSWEPIRSHFSVIHAALINVSPWARGELTTIYVKYSAPETGQQPFAVVWVKKASEIVVGLAMPSDNLPQELSGPPAGFKYAGLTGYFRVTSADRVPDGLAPWAAMAYEHTKRNATDG